MIHGKTPINGVMESINLLVISRNEQKTSTVDVCIAIHCQNNFLSISVLKLKY